jgi:hypothetical protein
MWSYHAAETLRPILTLVCTLTEAVLSCLRVWHLTPVRDTVTRQGRLADSLVPSALLPCMESHLRFW